MEIRQSERKKAKIKLALQGAAGSGKTYSSILLAEGLTCGDFSKIAIIDTENGSANLYAQLGRYYVLKLKQPFTPESYIEAIDACLKAKMEVIIIDSISHCWDNLLDFHANLTGNSFTNWAKVTPRHKAFIEKILQANAHIIATMRVKQDYVLNQKDGRYVPEKVGLKAIQRNDTDYEFTLVFDIDIKHMAVSSKDRTGLFMGKPEFILSKSTGNEILDWCNSTESLEGVREYIKSCKSMEDLRATYDKFYNWRSMLGNAFNDQKIKIQVNNHSVKSSNLN